MSWWDWRDILVITVVKADCYQLPTKGNTKLRQVANLNETQIYLQ